MKVLSKAIFILCFFNSFCFGVIEKFDGLAFKTCIVDKKVYYAKYSSGYDLSDINCKNDYLAKSDFYIDFSKISIDDFIALSTSYYKDNVRIGKLPYLKINSYNNEYTETYYNSFYKEYKTSTGKLASNFVYDYIKEYLDYKLNLQSLVPYYPGHFLFPFDDEFLEYVNSPNYGTVYQLHPNSFHLFIKRYSEKDFLDISDYFIKTQKYDTFTHDFKFDLYYYYSLPILSQFYYDNPIFLTIYSKYSYALNKNSLQPFDKLFPLSFDLKKQLYELPAKDRKDFFCRAKFGGSVSYANNTRIMPFYSSLRFLKQPTSNTAVIDLKQSWSKYEKKGLFAFVVAGASAFSIKKVLEPTSISISSDLDYSLRMKELEKLDVQTKNQVCEFDCVDESGNIQTAKMPFYYDLETKSINNDALAICSNTTMRNYDDFISSNGLNFSMNSFQKQLFEVELQKYIADYILMQKKEYYNELLKEYYDPSLDETYSIYADTHILEQARTTYQAKVFETEKKELIDMLNKGGFNELSLDYYKKYLDDETIDYYRKQSVAIDKNLDDLLNGKDSGFKADENTNSNIVTGVPPVDSNLTNDKTPPPPPLPPTNDKDSGFKADNTLNKGGAVGGGIGTGVGTGSNTAEKDLTKDNAQENSKDDTKENSKADDITISKDSTTTVEKTQTSSKVDVNVKTDVNVDVKANVTAKVEADDTLDKEYSKDINDFFNQFDKNPFDLDLSAFTKMYENFMNSKDNFLDKVKNYQMPIISKKNYDTCLFEKDVNLVFDVWVFRIDLCFWFSYLKDEIYFIFYILFSYYFIRLIFILLVKFSRS